LTAISAQAAMPFGPPATIPNVVASSLPKAKPLWVSADAAFSGEGDLRRDRFDDYVISMLNAHRDSERKAELSAGQSSRCLITLNSSGIERVADDHTPDDLARNAHTVIKGTVAASRPGFYLGQPGTLYAVRVSEFLKTTASSPRRVVFIFAETARIETASGAFCASSTSATPAIGDRVLLFALYDSPDATQAITPVDYRRTIVIEHGSALHLPEAFSQTQRQTFDAIVDDTRANPHLHENPLLREVR
jgi:hypothetical protein